MESRIERIIRLVAFLEADASKQDKIAEIKHCVSEGIITLEDGIDLAIEYFS